MASPQAEVFAFYDETTGLPLEGLTPTFDTYKDDLGADLAQPAVSEIGGGGYMFTPVFADEDRGIFYILSAGSGATPARVSRYMRPEDWAADEVAVVRKILGNRRKIHTTGPYTNQLVVYENDGTTVLLAFDLKDQDGIATAVNAYETDPV